MMLKNKQTVGHRLVLKLAAYSQAILLLFAGLSANAQDGNQLQDIQVQALPGQRVELTLVMSGTAPEPLAFTIVTNQGNDLRSKTAEIIQRRLKEVGIKIEIRIVEWATFLKEFIFPGNFDATILGWSGGPEPDQFNIWHSSKTAPRELNFIKYSNPEVDDLLEKGRRTFDLEKRKEIYDRFQEILAEEQPYTFLYVGEALPAVARRFRGITPAPAGITYNFIKWYVPKSEQKYTR